MPRGRQPPAVHAEERTALTPLDSNPEFAMKQRVLLALAVLVLGWAVAGASDGVVVPASTLIGFDPPPPAPNNTKCLNTATSFCDTFSICTEQSPTHWRCSKCSGTATQFKT